MRSPRERQALEAQVKSLSRLQAEAVSARAAIDRAVSAHTRLVESIDARRDLNAQLTGELEAAQQRLQGTVAQLGGARAAAAALPLRPFKGALPWPRGRDRDQPLRPAETNRVRPRTRAAPGSICRSARGSRSARCMRESWHTPTSSPAMATSSSSIMAKGVFALRVSRLDGRRPGRPSRRPGAARRLRPQPRRQPCLVLRVTGRRRRGRSLTMAETVGGTLPSGRFLVRSENRDLNPHDIQDPVVRPPLVHSGARIRRGRRADGPCVSPQRR